jgi:hypothetical protein
MTNKGIAKMLDLHSVPWYMDNGHLIAVEYFTTKNGQNKENHVDLTNNSRLQVLWFLGYDKYGT